MDARCVNDGGRRLCEGIGQSEGREDVERSGQNCEKKGERWAEKHAEGSWRMCAASFSSII